MKSHPWFRAALVAVLALSLASCGKSGSSTSPTNGGSGGTTSDDAQISQELLNYPQFWQEDLAVQLLLGTLLRAKWASESVRAAGAK